MRFVDRPSRWAQVVASRMAAWRLASLRAPAARRLRAAAAPARRWCPARRSCPWQPLRCLFPCHPSSPRLITPRPTRARCLVVQGASVPCLHQLCPRLLGPSSAIAAAESPAVALHSRSRSPRTSGTSQTVMDFHKFKCRTRARPPLLSISCPRALCRLLPACRVASRKRGGCLPST